MNRNLLAKKIFLSGLVCCFIIGVYIISNYFIIQQKMDATDRIPEDTVMSGYPAKDDILLKNKDKTIKTVSPTHYEDTTVPILTEVEMAKIIRKPHTGPQTVEALMESYHVMYLQNEWHRTVDEEYPPEPWLQWLLDSGYTILSYVEYVQFMDARAKPDDLNTPKLRQIYSERYGIPESDIERLKTVYLDNHLIRLQKKHALQRSTDDIITGGYYIGDKVLPLYLNRDVLYVERRETSTMYRGINLTPEQHFNLTFRGIEPEGIEVIYIDGRGNRLTEKPAPVTREEVRKMMAEGETPPEEWWDPDAPIPDPDDLMEFLPPETTKIPQDPQSQLARETKQAEFEQFMREVRQLEGFADLSDAEIADELEKQLRQQLIPEFPTEESLEDALRETITPKPLTPERLEKAKQILQNHGPKEGLRRLAKDDPELAEYFTRPPQTVLPKRTQPSTDQDSRRE